MTAVLNSQQIFQKHHKIPIL